MSNKAWNLIFNTLDLKNHNLALSPYYINSQQIIIHTGNGKLILKRKFR